MMNDKEIIRICEEKGIEYISFSKDSIDECFIKLWVNKVEFFVFNRFPLKTEVKISKEDLLKVFAHFGVNKALFSCAMYPIVENPTKVYFSPITGEVIQIGDDLNVIM